MPDAGALAAGLRLALALAAVLVLPGWLAVELAARRERGFARLAAAIGASIAVWPLVLLWTSLGGWPWTPTSYRVALAVVGAALTVLVLRRRTVTWPIQRPDAIGLAMLALLGLAALGRLWHARDLVAAPWVDGLHHTLITRLILDAGAVPASFEPYLPVDRFYYHFGFHGLAAAVTWLSGASSELTVLWLGQAVSVAAVPAAYYLAWRLVGDRLAALAAAAVPAGLYWFPAYYVSWGRFTQLAGLVALPVAWALLWDALRVSPGQRRAWPGLVLAAVVAAGLMLVHYRVALCFALGAALLAAVALGRGPDRRREVLTLASVTGAALILASPWIARVLWVGVGTLRAASDTWMTAPPEVDAVPAWLFTIGTNGLWLRLATVGLLTGLLRRQPAAWLVAAFLALVALASSPALLGLPSSWMLPRFALVIAAWLPVAVGLALVVDAFHGVAARWQAERAWTDLGLAGAALALAGADAWQHRGAVTPDILVRDAVALGAAVLALAWASRPAPGAPIRAPGPWGDRGRALAAAGIVALAVVGGWAMRDVLNRNLVLLTASDLRAAEWVRANTPVAARFLVRAADWQLGTYRGLDGGYWLPVTAGRSTTMPAVFYNYGAKAYGLSVADMARQVARGDALSDAELTDLMHQAGVDYLYLGPAGDGHSGTLTATRLDRHPGLERVYGENGVTIYQRRP